MQNGEHIHLQLHSVVVCSGALVHGLHNDIDQTPRWVLMLALGCEPTPAAWFGMKQKGPDKQHSDSDRNTFDCHANFSQSVRNGSRGG